MALKKLIGVAVWATIVGLLSDVSVHAKELTVGSIAPSFECLDDEGNVWKSDDHYGKKVVVIFFYPAAMTGG